jgi:flagellin-specific chaperone FliS
LEKKNLAAQALDHFRRSQEFLKQGNWSGYGEELKRVEALLKELQNAP